MRDVTERDVSHSLHILAAWCGSSVGPGVPYGSLLVALFVAGASGSLVHCIPMCGPFVLGQVSDRLACVPAGALCQAHRLRAGLLLPYHCGRMVTYIGLGALAALSGGGLARLPWLHRLSGALLLIGALLFLCQFLKRPPGWPRRLAGKAVARLSVRLGRLAARIDRSRPQGGFLLGVLLGFLPCGLLYAALAVAAAAPSAWDGAIRMFGFGLGTVPSLVAVGIAGPAFGRSAQRGLIAIGRPVLLLNAALLVVLAAERLQ